MKCLIVSGLGQEIIPHKGLEALASNYLIYLGYNIYYRSYKDDISDFLAPDISLMIGHSLGSNLLCQKLKTYQENTKAIFFDPVHPSWSSSKELMPDNISGLCIYKNENLFNFIPPSYCIMGKNIEVWKYDLDHNAIVEDDNIHKRINDYLK